MSFSNNKEFFRQFNPEEFDNIYEVNTFPALFNVVKRRYGLNPAVGKPDGTVVNFNQLLNDIAKVSTYFKSMGTTNKNIGVFCPNGYWFEVVSLGIIASGNVACLLPITLKKEMLNSYIKLLNIKTLIVADVPAEVNCEIINCDQLMLVDPLLNPWNNEVTGDTEAAILLTGGTTGLPKGVVLTQNNILNGAINSNYVSKKVFNQTYYCLLPLTHSFGFIRNMLAAFYGGSLIYYSKDKKEIFSDLIKYKPTILIMVPALCELFLNLIKSTGKQVVGGRLQTIITGAANVPPYLSREYWKLGIDFFPGYGLTETSNLVSGNPKPYEKPDSVGFLYPNQEAKIVNNELWLRGQNLFKGYYNNPLETKNSMEDGWFKTGDLARFDDEGYLYIIGRSKDTIVLPNGENVYPAVIESKISTLDLIQDCLVYDKVNEFGNTDLICEVTVRPAIAKKLNVQGDQIKKMIDDHISKINSQLNDYEHINKVIIRDKDFDRSPAMKILRKKH